MSGKLDNGQPLPPVRIKASEFPSMNWVTRDWGIGANLAAGQGTRDKEREAIQTISQDAKKRTVFTHTGWRKINGVWVFLHAGGALGGSSGVEVDLGSELSRYSLPEPGALEAARASMRLLEVAPWEITAPLIACAYLAPLTTQLQVDFTLWLLGPTGALKSSLVAVILSHFGDFDHTTLPGQWASTANALERRAFTP